MVPFFNDREILFMKTDVEKFDRYDIMVFANEKTTGNFIKRVIGLPGETLYAENGIIYIDGQPFDDVVDINIENYGMLKEGVTLGSNEYFVMGDNRNDSYDSREIGPVNINDVRGRVTFSISKLSPIKTKGDDVS